LYFNASGPFAVTLEPSLLSIDFIIDWASSPLRAGFQIRLRDSKFGVTTALFSIVCPDDG